MEEINVKLDVFEGPLDLLLHLIQQLELDIYDIPISNITEQYMSYIHAMKNLQLEVAGEYIVMAATLMAIKSKMLLPTVEYAEEFYDEEFYDEDPRDVLVAQLIEYKKFKVAASSLSTYAQDRQQYFSKDPMDIDEFKDTPTELAKDQINTIDLFLAFHQLLEKKKKRKHFEASISADETTIEEKLKEIELRISRLPKDTGCRFDSLFTSFSKIEIVTTFMALLELIKYHKVKVTQESNYDQIMIYPGEGTNEVLS